MENSEEQMFPGEMRTLSEVLEKLKGKGYDNELTFSDHGKLQGMGNVYNPEDLTIIKIFRFEGMSDPADNSAIYLIRDKEGGTGYVMDSYGMYSDHQGTGFDEFLKQIPVDDGDDWKNK